MLNLKKIHHVAVICSDYQVSKHFYTKILGFEIKAETFREERDSYKLDLCLNNQYCLELFSFPNPPKRISRPEALGLRHIAFEVDNIEETIRYLKKESLNPEPIRTDEFTGKKFTFIADPDDLPIEFYEA